jgi:type IV secretion system protein VirD4
MYLISRLLLMVGVLAGLYCAAVLVVVGWPMSAWVIVPVVLVKLLRRKGTQLTTLGSARFADENDLRRAGMLGAKSGMILGRMTSGQSSGGDHRISKLFAWRISAKEACQGFWIRRRLGGELVRLPQAVHTAVFSRSGGGKTVSCVIPHCTTCSDGLVVIDPKGEIASKTARLRRKRFGQQIALVDPYKLITQTPDTFNSLDFIDETNPQAIEHCRNMGDAIVERSPQEREAHWPESASMWIGGVIAVVAAYGKRGETRSMRTVYEFLSRPDRRDLAVKLMCESTIWNGALADLGGNLLSFVEREKMSVMTTVARNLSFLGTPAVMASVQHSSFDPALLRAGKLTVYLILPPSHQRTQAGLMRLWMSSLMQNVVSGGLQE